MEEKKIVIGFDVDNCLRDFTEGLNKVFVKQFPKYAHVIKDAWTWDWFWYYPWEEIMADLGKTGNTSEFADEWLIKNIEEIQSVGSAYPKVIEKLKEIIVAFSNEETEIVIVTCQRTEGAERVTEEWLKDLGVEVPIKFVKTFEGKWEHADILIDDSFAVLDSCPDNKVAIKINEPWNKDVGSSFSFDSVADITFEDIIDSITLFKLLQI